MNISKIISNQNIFAFSIIGLPIWWALGFDLFIYHIFAFAIFLNRSNLNKFSIFEYSILFTFCILFLSSLYASLNGAEISRILSSLFNASNNILIIAYSLLAYDQFYAGKSNVSHHSFMHLIIGMVILAGLGFVIYKSTGLRNFEIPTPISFMPGNGFALINEYKRLIIYKVTWFSNEYTFRAYVYAPFATASALICSLLTSLYFISKAAAHPVRYKFNYFDFAILMGSCFYIVISLTRTQIAALPGILIIGYLLARVRPSVLVIIALLTIPFIFGIGLYAVELLLSAREGSNSARFHSYQAAYDIVINSSPLFGIGYKPSLEEYFIPVGSHSAVLSYLIRGGLVAVSSAIFGFIIVNGIRILKIFQKVGRFNDKSRGLVTFGSSYFLALIVFFPFGEMDAYPVVSIMVGLFSGAIRAILRRASEI